MLTRANIKSFLLALPLAVMLCLAFSTVYAQETSPDKTTPVYLYNNVWDNKKIKNYYDENNLSAQQMDEDILNIIKSHSNDVSFLGGGKTKLLRLQNSLETLLSYTGKDGFDKFDQKHMGLSSVVDGGTAYNQLSKVNDFVNDLTSLGVFDENEVRIIKSYAQENFNLGADRALQALQTVTKTEDSLTAQNINDIKEASDDLLTDDCPTVNIIRAKYQSGCWSCLVVEKLSSAFMTAASKAYTLSQKAGLVLLGVGAMLWFVFWGLRNVSSLTQLEPGNILNELIKFGFKVALAYTFIVLGLPMLSKYFINPIMGVGAKIAETYWEPEKIKPYTENYDWESMLDLGGLSEAEQKTAKEQHAANVQIAEREKASQSLSMARLDVASMNEEERQQNLEEINAAARKVSISGVPQFITYPTTGTISSEFGRREYSGCRLHAGVDIAATVGTPVVASFDGTVGRAGWQDPSNPKRGYGLRLYIQHPGGWQTVYAHLSSIVVKSGDPVRKGNIIGYTGNTGSSGGPHLHFEIHTPQNRPVDPVGVADGVVNAVDYVGTRNECNNPYGMDQTRGQVSPNITPIPLSGSYLYGSQATPSNSRSAASASGASAYNSLAVSVPSVSYSGPTDIMSDAIMNSILGATKAIGDITSENMILGDVIMCYATLNNGGAWHPFGHTVTNFWMWFEGIFIWCTGMLLTLAVAYYLVDISFKIGFAVIAFPITVGLWPFEITKDKVFVCISIIAKSAAIFAFLAITTTFTVQLTDAVYSYEDDESSTISTDPNAPQGLAKLYEIYDRATMLDQKMTTATNATIETDIRYASQKLAIFSTTFVLLLFAFLYSFKLVQSTVPSLVNKFFPDKAFGNQQPMHHWATAATKWVKDQAMKPVGWARDAALYQGGRFAKNVAGKAVGGVTGSVRALAGKGKGDAKTVGGMATRGVGNITKGVGKVMSAVGLKTAGAAVQNAGQKVKNAGNQIDKSYNEFATRNKKDETNGKTDGSKKEGGGK